MNCTSNRQVIDDYQPILVEMVLDRIESLVNGRVETNLRDPMSRDGANPVRVFVKDEPHPHRKLDTERLRLISNVALVDVLVERLTNNELNKLHILHHADSPCRPGMGVEDSDFEALHDYLTRQPRPGNKPIASADVAGFDWSMQDWQMRWDASFRASLLHVENTSPRARVLAGRAEAVIGAVLATSDGKMWTLLHKGIQLSGSFNTSSTNTHVRVFIAYLCGATWAVANGDDCLEYHTQNPEEEYARLGHPLKFYTELEELEFCSHTFGKGQPPVLTNPGKLLRRYFRHTETDSELKSQLMHAFRHHPWRTKLWNLIR